MDIMFLDDVESVSGHLSLNHAVKFPKRLCYRKLLYKKVNRFRQIIYNPYAGTFDHRRSTPIKKFLVE